ncbi:two-component system, NtrC family, nitrogen regulation sensor histidine kinase GlnL [Tistlia consotensis]|uniref:histidine kinase n=1 Tax=Tistlia consotensis USBA 355 TaxID=560819 RepID=A0A1Y6BU74_9PROT|nr:ATP-binding protein [Tistlia consotensis]SMF25364.1 two-component system, NtrC family, nitrogen regulation sensor histidine kinase GlnL [Tistlia consotensis USBA 355]SNR59470.1 two-component system, NtrC family, nitrogen regulation sensor histidine kinase GlnL [Tistlia consotensis]
MARVSTQLLRRVMGSSLDPAAVLNALAEPVFCVDEQDCFLYLNLAAEQFFGSSMRSLDGRPLSEILPADSPVFGLIAQARQGLQSLSEYEVVLESPRIGAHTVSIDVSAVPETPGAVAVTFKERSIARKIEHQFTHRNAARSVTAMAAMLAHEVKNPLSGIRGAAQLLESSVEGDDRELTRLITAEADRIVALVDRMEMFADRRPIDRQPINIHEVLGHVRRLAENGVARKIRFVEIYDPSLPPVLGNRDLLIQVFLNLVKNAAEALHKQGEGEIQLSTRYQQGVRLAIPGGGSRVDLPLVVSVQDNGPGIPEDLRGHLFDPFVTGKPNGKGLGLALVAKIVGDHGGVIEFDSEPNRTVFRTLLPKAD